MKSYRELVDEENKFGEELRRNMVMEHTMFKPIHSHLTNKYSFSKFLGYLYKGKTKDFNLGENNGRKNC